MRRSTISSFTDSWAINRRKVVQRCPAVPTAPNRMPRTARSRSALGARIIALLPPSSRMQRAKRAATRGATSRPMRVLPVALTRATRRSSTSASPASRSPISNWLRCAGASPPKARAARSNSAWQASAVRGVFSEGFQTTELPQTSASAVFHDHTATGKLNALITPTTPSGCQVSRMWWPGRSDAMVRPYNWRERPTAKSQISIISWTSPRPSWVILPASQDTSSPSSALCRRNSSPNSRTSSPRRGAGTWRQARNACSARSTLAATAARPSSGTAARRLPSMGVCTASSPSRKALGSRPRLRSNPSIM